MRSAVSKRGCAFRDIDGHACGGTSHKVTAKALLAVYLRAVHIDDGETAAALHEYIHPARADLFVCAVDRGICTAMRVDFDARVGRGAGLCSLSRRRSRAAGTMPLVTRARWLFSAHV